MNYEQAREYLEKTLAFGINLGLERMRRLCALLGDPQKDLRCIHIAGTNGKGSTASYCASILAAAGNRTGLFTSPYLTRLTERIRIIEGPEGLEKLSSDEAEGEISGINFARGMSLVKQAVDKMLDEGYDQPTEFEILTALAFWYFAYMKCRLVVLETGLGGRLDSTNIIEKPVACLITALGYDHMDRLGSTIEQIAAEKAGIIKQETDVFLYDPYRLELGPSDQAGIAQVMNDRVRQKKARLHVVDFQDIRIEKYDLSGQQFAFRGHSFWTRLLGTVQPMNAAMAISLCLDMKLADFAAAETGIRSAYWPARMELVRLSPPVILDGAHNPQSCQVLSRSLDHLLPGRQVIFLAGMLRDKDYPAMLDEILRTSTKYKPAAFVCTSPDSPRALEAKKLAETVKDRWHRLHQTAGSGYNIQDAVAAEDNIEKAARKALRLADQMDLPLCVFGSFYLVGAIRPILLDKEGKL